MSKIFPLFEQIGNTEKKQVIIKHLQTKNQEDFQYHPQGQLQKHGENVMFLIIVPRSKNMEIEWKGEDEMENQKIGEVWFGKSGVCSGYE